MLFLCVGLYTASDLKQLAEESQIMAKFDHPNVMNLLGVSISKSKTLLIIMPFMAQGSLLSYLKKHRDELAMSSEDIAESEKQVYIVKFACCLTKYCFSIVICLP